MKIVMFQYNRDASAIISDNNLSRSGAEHQIQNNSILAHGYHDRLLWEEAASLKPKPKSEYIILGNWH
ncbi:hypothetical protein JWJ90_19795 [Desulfobulbus rhabdoformis]|jgi:hypothetical protein|uniref:hypothetical protein n=1 Tax=Desulfobulbus rhabdoformis TaxID=34032 RepID=UPI0019668A33|nr:hypothetical protein [Desulfobulbus rhabdoformis]MBM9616512.1 hypothetical protein [Desulfobulbus rhabdoformis]